MRGKDLLYDLSFIDDDLIQEAASDEMPECFKKGNKAGKGINDVNAVSRSRQRSRRRLIAMAACLMLAVGVTAGLSQTDMWPWINMGNSVNGGAHDDTAGAPDKGNGDDKLLVREPNDSSDLEASEDAVSEDVDGSSAGGAGAVTDGNTDSAKKYSGSQKEYAGSQGGSGASSIKNGNSTGDKYDAAVLPGSGSTDAGYGAGDDRADTSVMSPGPGAADEDGNSGSSGSTAAGGAPDTNASGGSSSSGGGGSSNSNDAASNASVITSQKLADYLAGLDYTGTVSGSEAEYIVSSGSGAVYYVNLTEGSVRTADGEAKLTAAQIQYIRSVM